MRIRPLAKASLFASALLLTGCFTMSHTVGAGPAGGEEPIRKTQWWAGWGLLPIGDVTDSQKLAEEAKNYKVTTEFTFMDVLISAIPSIFTFYRQTITVER